MFVEDWGYLEGQYFTFQTISTIGFGDIVAGDSDRVIGHSWKRAGYRYSLIIYIIVGLSAMGILLRIVRRCEEKEAERVSTRTQQFLGYDHDTSSSASKRTAEQKGQVNVIALKEATLVGGDISNREKRAQVKQVIASESVTKKDLSNTVNQEVQTDITVKEHLAELNVLLRLQQACRDETSTNM
ncbi:Potassium channel subfamily K member 5 [Holothuria leucospilota]|uniref:Potassium channel subfamily K member 5 n=1 Tax=Holothuria leucospilota TaxID=206669 RepID=A0A9Q1HJV1_HOLLE|nr:Potassium channel subfamily K member 5 [Holothuria leucospilota]